MALKEAVISILRRPKRLTAEEYLRKLTERGLHADGTQKLDPIPMAPPIGYKKQPSMVEIVRDMVRGERLKAEAEAAGHETFEESEDFNIPDEHFLESPWVNEFDPPIHELVDAGKKQLELKRTTAKPPAPPESPAPVPPSDGQEAAKT